MLNQYEVFLPTALAILSLALFSDKTRTLCYVTVALSIVAELVPMSVNVMALVACCACLGALIVSDVIHHSRHFRNYFQESHVTHHHVARHHSK